LGNRAYSLSVRPTGHTFELGSESSQVEVKRGDIVTLSYENYTRVLKPINPILTRVRTDVTWKDVLHGSGTTRLNGTHNTNLPTCFDFDHFLEPSLRGFGLSYQPSSDEERREKLRAFLESFAKKMNIDPLIAENWYNVKGSQVEARVSSVSSWIWWALQQKIGRLNYSTREIVYICTTEA
jgi:hypothetical protein